MSSFFVQECPTCSRRLHIRVKYLGKRVVCQHCRGKFIAFDSSTKRYTSPESTDVLLRRVDELLESTTQIETPARNAQPR